MDYLKLLEHSFQCLRKCDNEAMNISRLEYLSEHIFDFTTYDGAMDELFARKALDVCVAINDRNTFEYLESSEGYQWYLIMCNMPFFASKLEWGTSIRGAWWGMYGSQTFELSSCGLWEDGKPLAAPLKFNREQWEAFIAAMLEFVAGEDTQED